MIVSKNQQTNGNVEAYLYLNSHILKGHQYDLQVTRIPDLSITNVNVAILNALNMTGMYITMEKIPCIKLID